MSNTLSLKQAQDMTSGQLIQCIVTASHAECKYKGMYKIPNWAYQNVKVCCRILRERGFNISEQDENNYLVW